MSPELLVRSPVVLRADPRRVVARLFLPGEELLADGRARVDAVVDRVQAMPDTEVAALADACARALAITGDPRWQSGLDRCRAWFLGANDTGVMLLDVVSGGGFDGLMQHGRNENQGAESTLALISTLQHGATASSRA